MKNARITCVLLLGVLIAACSAKTRDANESWIAQVGGLGPEIVFDITATADGRLCSVGTFYNDAEFGSENDKKRLSAENIQDIFLACHDQNGRLSFATQFGARIGDEPRAIAALPNGDVVITGYFGSDFGAGKAQTLTADNNPEIFLSRIDAAGKAVWTTSFGGRLADSGNSLSVNPAGEILLAGSFQDVMLARIGDKTRKVVSAGNRDAFVMKLDGDGNPLWIRSFGGSGRDEASRVTSDAEGNVYVGGTFSGQGQIDGEPGSRLIALGKADDAYILAFNSMGESIWARSITGANRENVSGLAADSSGNIYMVGGFQQTVITPNGMQLESAGSRDIFMISFGPGGAQRWARRIGGEQIDEAFDATWSKNETLLLTGHFEHKADFDPGSDIFELRSAGPGNSDAFLAEISTEGELVDAISAGGDGVEMLFAVTALDYGDVAVAGFFNKEIDLAISGVEPLAKRGKTDVFIARLGQTTFRQ